MKTRWRILGMVMIIGLGIGGWHYWTIRSGTKGAVVAEKTETKKTKGGKRPIPVLAETVKTADVPVYLSGVGTVAAYNKVMVGTQVDGKLLKLGFTDGQEVKAGSPIAEIDPVTYKAVYERAVAKKAQDEADLANARRDLVRYRNLARNNYGSKQQADTQASTVAQLKARVQYDQANIDNAKATLDETQITAPISGRTGMRLVDVGNIVRRSDTTGIVTITQVRPISIIFTIPEQSLSAVVKGGDAKNAVVEAFSPDGHTVVARGVLVAIDNQIDPTTGTIKLKATFPNDDESLWPGQFINVRIRVKILKDAVVVPTGAVQQGPKGPIVFVIGKDRKVKATTIAIARQGDTRTVIARGLKSGEQVVTSGFVRLADGSPVKVSGEAPADARPPTGGAGAGESRGAKSHANGLKK